MNGWYVRVNWVFRFVVVVVRIDDFVMCLFVEICWWSELVMYCVVVVECCVVLRFV